MGQGTFVDAETVLGMANAEIPIDEALECCRSQIEAARYYADSLPTFFPLHFGASGLRIKYMPEQPTVWNDPQQMPPEEVEGSLLAWAAEDADAT